MIATLHSYAYINRITTNNHSVKQLPFKKTVATNQTKPFNLATAYKGNVISYARDLSDTVNATKQSTFELLQVVSKFADDKNSKIDSKDDDLDDDDFEGEEFENYDTSTKKTLLKSKYNIGDIEAIFGKVKKLAKALNKTASFEKNISQSKEFNEYSSNVSSIVKYSEALNEMGINYENGEYKFDEEIIKNLSGEDIKGILARSYGDLTNIHNNISGFLAVPLSKHMTFKNFSYYYSYSTGAMKNNSFNLVDSGILLNLEV